MPNTLYSILNTNHVLRPALVACSVLLVASVATLPLTATANEPMTTDNYRLDPSVSDSFGGFSESDKHQLLDSGGQTVIGLGNSPSYKLSQGYIEQLEQSIEINVLPDGIAGYWPLNTGTGIQAYDTSADNSHGVLTNGPGWADGKVGTGSLNLDGANDYVDLGSPSSLNITGDITLSSWVKLNSANNDSIISWANSYSSFPFHHNVDTDYIRFNGGSAGNITSNEGVKLNEWQHVVVTVDGTELRFYVNGVPDSGNPFTLSTANRDSGDGFLTLSRSTSQYLDGQIDNVKVYDKPLSEEEVTDEYNATKTGVPSALTLPRVAPGASQSVNADVLVRTDAGGYNLAIEQDGDLRTEHGDNIPPISSSITFPDPWNEGSTNGFGFTVIDAVQRDGKWGSDPDYEYAAVPGTSSSFHSRDGLSGGVKEITALQFRLGVDGTQAGGIYSNRLGFTATLKP